MPPVPDTVTEPVLFPKQSTFVVDVATIPIAAGSVMVVVFWLVQPFASVTVKTYDNAVGAGVLLYAFELVTVLVNVLLPEPEEGETEIPVARLLVDQEYE